MACNGYRNVETWKFMVYFEDFLCETLIEQEKYNEKQLDYKTVHNTVKYFIDEMRDGADKNIVGSSFLNEIINEYLNEIDIKEVVDNIANALEVSE